MHSNDCTEPDEMPGISGSLDHIDTKPCVKPILVILRAGTSQIQRWQLPSRGDKLEELEEEIRKQGG